MLDCLTISKWIFDEYDDNESESDSFEEYEELNDPELGALAEYIENIELESLQEYIEKNPTIKCKKTLLEWLSQGREKFKSEILVRYENRNTVFAQHYTYQLIKNHKIPFYKLEDEPEWLSTRNDLACIINSGSDPSIVQKIVQKFEPKRIAVMTKAIENIIKALESTGGILFCIDVGESHAHRLSAHVDQLGTNKSYNIEVIPCVAISNYPEMDSLLREIYSPKGRVDARNASEALKKMYDDNEIRAYYEKVPIKNLRFIGDMKGNFECKQLDELITILRASKFIQGATPLSESNVELVLSYLFETIKTNKMNLTSQGSHSLASSLKWNYSSPLHLSEPEKMV